MAGTPQAFQADAFANDAFQTGVAAPVSDAVVPITYGGGHDDDLVRRVQSHWAEIDRLRAERKERESAEREKQRALEARRQALAELEAEKSRKRAKKAQQARDAQRKAILDEIDQAERELSAFTALSAEIEAEILRIEAEIQAAGLAAFIAKRNAAVALLLLAS